MTKKDVPVVHRLLREYLSLFNLVPAMNQEEVEHWLLPRENIIDTYLVEVNQFISNKYQAFVIEASLWNLYIVLLTEQWKGDWFPQFLHSAFHHYEPPCAPQPKGSILLLQCAHNHALARPDARCSDPGQIGVFSSSPECVLWTYLHRETNNVFSFHRFIQKGFDVFNALDLMENKTFLDKLKFGIGDGNLQYYLYNWKCPSMGPEKVSEISLWDCMVTRCVSIFKILDSIEILSAKNSTDFKTWAA